MTATDHRVLPASYGETDVSEPGKDHDDGLQLGKYNSSAMDGAKSATMLTETSIKWTKRIPFYEVVDECV